jgi:hypothetical protein
MGESGNDNYCDCLPDCEEVVFSASEVVYVIDAEDECDAFTQEGVNMAEIIGEKLRYMDGEEYLYWYQQIQANATLPFDFGMRNIIYRYVDPAVLVQQKCWDLLQTDLAFLTVEVAEPEVIIYKRDVASTFVDKVSNLGKYCQRFAMLATPVIIRSPELTNIWPGQYTDG